MPDDATNRLIYRPCGLLVVPVFARQSCDSCAWLCPASFQDSLLVEILLLEDDFWVGHLRERYSYYDHASCSVIREIETLRDAATAHAHQDCSVLLTLTLVFLEDLRVVPVDDELVLSRLLWFPEDLLVLLEFVKHA